MSALKQNKGSDSEVTITDFEKTALDFVNSVDDDQDLELMQRFCSLATQLSPESFSKMMKHVQKSIDEKSTDSKSKSKSKSKQVGEGKSKLNTKKDSNVGEGKIKRKTKKATK